MQIVWDEPKRLANLEKHGLDFADFETGFSWHDFAAASAHPSRLTGRPRAKFIGRMHGMVVAAIVSPLGSEAMSLVSLRPADLDERVRYAER